MFYYKNLHLTCILKKKKTTLFFVCFLLEFFDSCPNFSKFADCNRFFGMEGGGGIPVRMYTYVWSYAEW